MAKRARDKDAIPVVFTDKPWATFAWKLWAWILDDEKCDMTEDQLIERCLLYYDFSVKHEKLWRPALNHNEMIAEHFVWAYGFEAHKGSNITEYQLEKLSEIRAYCNKLLSEVE